MIFDAISQWIATVLSWIVGQMPGLPTPPAIIVDGSLQIGQLMQTVNGFCGWVDFDFARQGAVIVLGVWTVAFVLRLLRIAFGFFVG